MPKGLVRSDPNHGGTSYRNGFAVVEPLEFNTPITTPHQFGTTIPVADQTLAKNQVTWTPSPAHFGNTIAPAVKQATPTFNPVEGSYSGEIFVEIDSAGNDAIYYTTDGSTPTTASTLYNPIDEVPVAASLTLKAIAVAAGKSQSDVGTAAYTITVPEPPAIVQTAVLNTASDTNYTLAPFGAPMTIGNSVYVLISVYQAVRAVVSVTDDGGVNVYTLVSGPDGPGNSTNGSVRNWLYSCEALTNAASTIIVTLDGAQYKQVIAVEVSVAGGFPQLDNVQYASAPATATPQPLSGPDITTGGDAELLLGYVAQENANDTYTPNTGWDAVLTNGNPANASSFLMSQDAATAGTYSSTGGTASAATGTANYAIAIKQGAN